MGYRTSTGSKRWARARAVTLQASVTKTATFKSAGVELGDASSARVTVAVSAISGGNHSTVFELQTSVDDVDGNYARVGSAFTAITATTTGVRVVFGPLDRFVRLVQTLDGTTVTYSAVAEVV